MIHLWSEPTAEHADRNMPQEILTRLGSHISIHPWWLARAKYVEKKLQLQFQNKLISVLDVGCGWGVTLKHLEKCGHQVWGLDVGMAALNLLDGPGRRLILGDVENGHIPNEMHGKFDAVLALDVLEHLDFPELAIKNLIKLTRPGGLIIISVPAMMELWSEFDEIQGHRKRYDKKELSYLLESARELEDLRIGYCWPWLVTMARLTRLKKNSDHTHEQIIDPWKIYEKYVKPGPLIVRCLMKFGFRLSERQTMRGKARQGTSILATATRKI